jgi:hypothetical protein
MGDRISEELIEASILPLLSFDAISRVASVNQRWCRAARSFSSRTQSAALSGERPLLVLPCASFVFRFCAHQLRPQSCSKPPILRRTRVAQRSRNNARTLPRAPRAGARPASGALRARSAHLSRMQNELARAQVSPFACRAGAARISHALCSSLGARAARCTRAPLAAP